jgi:predicted  nucleic acid-binding Zn-ribbon protein
MAVTLEDRTTALERAQGETTETLRWVVAKLGRMQAVQDEHTLRMERLETKVDRLEVKVDRLESRLDTVEGKLDALPRAMAEMIAASEKRIMAAIVER